MSAGKYAYLEAIRGIAALWVVFIHVLPRFWQPALDVLLAGQYKLSVPIFFVLTGRVLPLGIVFMILPSLTLLQRYP